MGLDMRVHQCRVEQDSELPEPAQDASSSHAPELHHIMVITAKVPPNLHLPSWPFFFRYDI